MRQGEAARPGAKRPLVLLRNPFATPRPEIAVFASKDMRLSFLEAGRESSTVGGLSFPGRTGSTWWHRLMPMGLRIASIIRVFRPVALSGRAHAAGRGSRRPVAER